MATEDIAVTKFREYLRVKTEQPNPDYEACRSFLFNLADELNIEKKSAFVVAEAPFVIMTIPGSKPELPSVMLYSHTDVVPTFPEHWKYDPYSAYKDEKGDIYARGSQDMKCVGSQYFEAIRRHFNNGKKQWLRTIHIVWGPDEEIGGVNGMKTFCSSDDFKKLNVGFTLDEGIATEDDVYKVFYAERSPWWLKVTFGGSPGHGSKFIENTAMEKLHKFMNNAMSYRAEQMEVLKNNPDWTVGDVTSLNLTIVNGGVQVNVVPDKFIAYCDIRVTPREDCSKLKARIEKWGTDAGDDVTLEFIQVISREK
ncbi:unnamed protein product [Caenorhabditis auriculariae]|uniref:N-acyl-aliphatic-L-amino acid amidohydrolase n=1 Tax=Caenorhabditis auriculariae TaxID=2777116 RepID=A0A8S1HJ38_9PELO|nr:unnamed protein product [Caenorhabditis auriculariae]